jgi:Transposase DNA-binding
MINQWVRQELEKTQLGDARRTNRFMKIVSNLSNKPTSSVPEASGTWAETKATYDFWDSPYIKPAQLRKGHVDATLSRIKNHQIILAIQDTTELNYTTHEAVKGVGYLDNKYAHGLKVHSTLAATTEGLPLGIIDQYVWARAPKYLGKAAQRSQKSTEEKESQRWLDA